MSLSIRDVSVAHGQETEWTLKKLNLEVTKGEVIGIIGPTGSGKSTFFKLLNGTIPYIFPGRIKGDIIVDGLNTQKHSVKELVLHVGLVPSDPNISMVAITVEDDVAFGPQCLGFSTDELQKTVYQSLSDFRLSGFEKRVTYRLSGGESQAVCIAGIHAMKPKIFALDEPLCSLDPVGKDQVMSAIRQLNEEFGLTILLSEAGGDIGYIAPFCSRIVVLSDGKIIADAPTREILTDTSLLRKVRMRAPQVTEVTLKLSKRKTKNIPITIEEGVKFLTSKLKSRKIKITERKTSKHKKGKPIITVRNLYHTFSGLRPVYALKNINLDIHEGEMVGLVGQNGSGKTTLSLHLVGIHKPTNPDGSTKPIPDAKVIVDGVDVASEKTPIKEIIKHINYAFQNPDNQLFCDFVEEEISFIFGMLGIPEEEARPKIENIIKEK